MQTVENFLCFLTGATVYLLTLYTYVILAAIILNLLIAFGVVQPYNDFVRALNQALRGVTEPVFRMARRYMPDTGAIDLSPMAVLIGIFLIQWFIRAVVEPAIPCGRSVVQLSLLV